MSFLRVGFSLATTMPSYTILCVGEDFAGSSIALSLRNNSHHLLMADSPSRAMAYVFVNRHIDAVVIEQRQQPFAGLNTAHLLRTVRADVPILLLSSETLDPLPFCVDACLSGDNLLDRLLLTLDLLLARPAGGLAPGMTLAR